MKQNAIIIYFKSILENLLLFWCPWGRTSRRSFVYFFWSYSFCFLVWVFLFRPKEYLEIQWVSICLCIPFSTAITRRGHDLGYSGWKTLILSYPEALRLFREEGDKFSNQYGNPPR